MAETTKTSVQKDNNGYYRTRIPKALADAMDLGDEKMIWKMESKKKLSIQIADDE